MKKIQDFLDQYVPFLPAFLIQMVLMVIWMFFWICGAVLILLLTPANKLDDMGNWWDKYLPTNMRSR